MANIREGIEIVVTDRGSKIVRSNLQAVGKAGKKAANGVDDLRAILGLLAIRKTLSVLKEYSDTFTEMQNRLRLVTTGTENLKRVTSELGDIANRSRSAFKGTADIYARVALATAEMGVSQQELLNFTESLNQATILSGASAKEASNGIIQLGQGLASGALRGDELRSVLEQLPAVADVIAKGMGVARGELRELGKSGAITAKIVLDAFKKARVELNDKFAKTVPTIAQSFTVLENNVIFFINTLNEATGIASTFSQAMLFIANNMKIIGPAVLVVGGAIASILVPAMFAFVAATGAVTAAVNILSNNSMVILVRVVIGAVTALVLFRREMISAGGIIGSIGSAVDFLVRVVKGLGTVFANAGSAIVSALGGPENAISRTTVAVIALSTAILIRYARQAIPAAITATLTFFRVLLANPIVRIVVIVGSMIAALVSLGKEFKVVRQIAQAVWDAVKFIFEGIKATLDALGITSLANSVINVLIDGQEAAEAIKAGHLEGGEAAAGSILEAHKKGGEEAAKSNSQKIQEAFAKGGKEAADKMYDSIHKATIETIKKRKEAADAERQAHSDNFDQIIADMQAGISEGGKRAGESMAQGAAVGGVQGAKLLSAAGVEFSRSSLAVVDKAGLASGSFESGAKTLLRAVGKQIALVKQQGNLLAAQAQLAKAQAALVTEQKVQLRLNGGNTGSSSGGSGNTKTSSIIAFQPGEKLNQFAVLGDPNNRGLNDGEKGEVNENLLGFAKGGSFKIDGRSGVDNNLLSINNRPVVKVSKGEDVIVSPNSKKAGAGQNESNGIVQNISITIVTPDADSFMRSPEQVQAKLAQELARSNDRNN